MARHLSAEEVRAEYVAAMGQGLGPLFYVLWNECVWLHARWAEHRELFGTSVERVALLNSAARFSFRIIQDILWDSTLLHLCRLTDPPSTVAKSNLTVQRLPALVDPTIRDSTQALVAKTIASTDFARDWRNRRIAHADLELALDRPVTPLAAASRRQVSDALKTIADLLNHVEGHYRGTAEVVYGGHGADVHPGGAVDLLYVIRNGLEAETARGRRLKQGEPLPEDLQPPRPL